MSSFFIFLSYIFSFTKPNYEFSLLSPVLMILEYTPIALIEIDILKKYKNKVRLGILLHFHIIVTYFLIVIYFIFIVLLTVGLLTLR